jgi:Tfp pilus assembly protein PilV
MIFTNKTAGYSLVEVLIAISILMITIVGPLTIAQKGLKNASFAKEQNTAFFLAQEGIEAIVKMREDSALASYVLNQNTTDVWAEIENLDMEADGTTRRCYADSATNSPCGIDIDTMELFTCSETDSCNVFYNTSGRANYGHDENGDSAGYLRFIYLDTDDTRIHVRSVVFWGPAVNEFVILETYIYNIYEY